MQLESRNYLEGWGGEEGEGKLHVVSNHTHRGTAFKSNQNGNAFPTKRRALSKCSIFSNLIAGATTTTTEQQQQQQNQQMQKQEHQLSSAWRKNNFKAIDTVQARRARAGWRKRER